MSSARPVRRAQLDKGGGEQLQVGGIDAPRSAFRAMGSLHRVCGRAPIDEPLTYRYLSLNTFVLGFAAGERVMEIRIWRFPSRSVHLPQVLLRLPWDRALSTQ